MVSLSPARSLGNTAPVSLGEDEQTFIFDRMAVDTGLSDQMMVTNRTLQAECSRPVVIMLLAKAFQTDPRPRQEAKTLVDAGYRVFVLAWDQRSEFRNVENVEGVVVRSFCHMSLRRFTRFGLAMGAMVLQFLFFVEAVRLISQLRQRPIVHAHDFNTLLPGVLLRIFRLSAGLVYDCHELTFAAYSELFSPSLGSTIGAIEQRCLRYADFVITVSDPIANYLRRFSSDTEVLYNCPRITDIPKLSKRDARIQLGLPVHSFIVSYVGTMRYDSRVDLMFAVASRIKTENIRFVILGGGPLAGEFERRAKHEEVSRSLTILPHVPREEALSYLSASDLAWVVYTDSLNSHIAMPWKFFEALSCGVPVIVEAHSFRGKLVEKLGCGVVIESEVPDCVSNIIVSVAGNPQQHRRMCIAAREAARAINWESMSQKLIEVYKRLGRA